MSVNIQTSNGLKKIADKTTKKTIKEALGYIPVPISVEEVKDEVKKDVIDIINTSYTYASRVIFDDGVSLAEKYAKGELGSGGGGGGGIVEVSELPEVGKANTVYKLIHKNVGTVVPTTGLIEKIYFNTNLSVEEVNAILKTIEYIPATNEGEPDIYIVFETLDSIVIIFDYNNGSYAIMVGMNVAYVSDESFVSAGATFVGWNPDLTNPCVVYQESTPTDDFVSQNDKLTSLFSVTPFEEKIPSEMYYLYKENEWVQISGGILEVDKLPTSGEDNYVYALKKQPTYDVYVNEKEQGISNLTELAKQSGGKVEVVAVVNILPTENIIVSPSDREMNLYYIKNDGLYVYADFTGDGNVTWHNFADAMGLPFSGEVTSESDMTVTDSLYLLSSGGDSANYYIYEKGEPTQVPNSGLIENLYFNTKLSVEETDAILSQLTYDYDGYAYVVGAYEKGSSYGNIIIVEANAFTQGQIPSGYIIGHMHDTANMASTEFIYMSNQGLVDLALTMGINTKVGWNMETLNLNQTFIGHYGTENDKLINVISTTPYPRWTKISDGGATVKATPEVVPNSGYVEKIYLNKSLSFDEINAICTKANDLVANELLKANVIACNKDANKLLAVTKFTDTDDTNVNVIVYPSLATVIWSEKDYYHVETSGTITQWKKGWNIEENYLEFNDEVVAEANIFSDVTCGTYNDQLTELFSINNVFKTEEIQLSEEYDGSPITVTNMALQGTEIPTTGTIGTVYCNTSMSVEEVVKVLKTLNYETDGSNEFCGVVETLDRLIRIIKTGNVYGILDGVMFVFVSESVASTNFVGWNPEYTTISVNQESTLEEGTVLQNDKLKNVLSITPFEEKPQKNFDIDIKSLLEEKKLPLEIKVNVESESANVVKSGGTVVPNNTYVENIYFNTSLSIDEVVALLSQLTYTSEGMSALALNATKPIILTAGVINGVYIIADFYNMIPYFASAISTDLPQEVFNFVGWNPNFDGILAINGDLVPNEGSMTVGTENDKLIDLMSITNSFGVGGEIIKTLGGDYEAVNIEVTENKTVDVETYLDNKQIPINVKVNVGQFVEVTGDSGTLTTAQMSLLANDETYVLKDGVKYYYTHSETIDSTEIKHYRAILKYDTTTSPDTITLGEFAYLTSNGLWQSGESKVNVEPNLQEKEITENGEYVADEGYDGFSKVTVNVASSGEDMLQARVDATNSCEYLFYQYKGDNVDFIKDLDTSNVTNTSYMFYNCNALTEIPPLDTSKVTSMREMFYQCKALTTIPQLDMIKVSNAGSMFNQCSKLTNLTLLNIKAQIDLSQNEKLTLESLINTVKEFINAGNARILTMGTANLSKIASTYVKFTDSSVTSIPKNEKGDVVVCESTDTGAMLLKDYALLKNWTLA